MTNVLKVKPAPAFERAETVAASNIRPPILAAVSGRDLAPPVLLAACLGENRPIEVDQTPYLVLIGT
jgi:hypothetical protein